MKKITLNAGFTLVEVLVVAIIMTILVGGLIFNFRGSSTGRVGRYQAAFLLSADIRRAQTMALSGSNFQDQNVCGYGIHHVSENRYMLYAGAATPTCAAANRNYQAGTDLIVQEISFPNISMEMKTAFSDIFFESPDPKTYINNATLPTAATAAVDIGAIGSGCSPTTCTTVSVSTSGQINVSN